MGDWIVELKREYTHEVENKPFFGHTHKKKNEGFCFLKGKKN